MIPMKPAIRRGARALFSGRSASEKDSRAERALLGCVMLRVTTSRPDRRRPALSMRRALVRMIEDGPILAVHGVARWRLVDLRQWTFEEFRVTISPQTMSREVRALAPGSSPEGSARPRHHAQAVGAIEDFKKNFPARLEEVARERNVAKDDIEIWFADAARIGQKNKITRRWAKRGSRPWAPSDQPWRIMSLGLRQGAHGFSSGRVGVRFDPVVRHCCSREPKKARRSERSCAAPDTVAAALT